MSQNNNNNNNWKTFSIEINLDHHDASDLGVKFMLPINEEKECNEDNKSVSSSKRIANEMDSNKSFNDDQSYLNHVDKEIENEYNFVLVDSVSKNGIAYGKLK